MMSALSSFSVSDTRSDDDDPTSQEAGSDVVASEMSPADPSAVADDSRSPAAAATASAGSTGVADNPYPVVVPDVGDRCRVNWRNGEVLEAEIVARRPSKSYLASAKASERGGGRKRKSSGASGDALTVNATSTLSSSSSSSGPSSAAFDVSNLDKPRDVEYYVHYVGHDRRLDEWIAFDKIQVESLQSAGSRGPTTTDSALQGLDDSSPMLSPAMGAGGITRRRSSAALGTSGAASSAVGSASDDDDQQQQAMGSTGGGNFHPQDATFEREHEETTKIKNVERIIMGCHEVQCWYYSPFPDAYSNVSTLYVCEYCLTYMKKAVTYKRNHVEGCKVRCPPGRRIYLEGDLAVYEIDGKDHKPYCQKLCLLAKLFLDHKTLYYDVTPFLFYVVCTVDHHGAKMVGYFSKEKVSEMGYNLACILTLPQYQHKGYGKFIISLSYELTKREGKTGSPEKPLSDLGKVSYRSYWTHVLINLLNDHDPHRNLSILDMSIRTGIKTEDIISTLQFLDMIKVWKGQHVAYIKQSTLRSYLKQKAPFRQCKPEFLDWQPPS